MTGKRALPFLYCEKKKKKIKTHSIIVPPYACAFALMFLTSYTSDRFKDRGIHITVLSSIAAIAYACLANLGDDKLSAKYGLMVGLNSNIPSILLLYLSHSNRRPVHRRRLRLQHLPAQPRLGGHSSARATGSASLCRSRRRSSRWRTV